MSGEALVLHPQTSLQAHNLLRDSIKTRKNFFFYSGHYVKCINVNFLEKGQEARFSSSFSTIKRHYIYLKYVGIELAEVEKLTIPHIYNRQLLSLGV